MIKLCVHDYWKITLEDHSSGKNSPASSWLMTLIKAFYVTLLFHCFFLLTLLLCILLFFFVELETKRILLDIFKEKQQKSAEAGTIPSFYKKVRVVIAPMKLESKHYVLLLLLCMSKQ